MAKIVITIEDTPRGTVTIKCSPSFQEICELINSGNESTSAHGYAMSAVRLFMKISKDQDPMQKILIPRIGRV